MLKFLAVPFAVLFVFLQTCNGSDMSSTNQTNNTEKAADYPRDMPVPEGKTFETATFAAGCFWCVEGVFQELKGVYSVVSGYSGGEIKNPTYKQVSAGATKHAEAVQIIYDPAVITYEELLEVLWKTHDPTTLNRQGPDKGYQYRSAIFYHDEAQKLAAEKTQKEIAEKVWSDPITTQIVAFDIFYDAEDYHQNFFWLNPNQGYVVAVTTPKVRKARKLFKDKLKEGVATY
ncbi:MAG: peptide-methionine (S)-S-oxide reductase MsrA [Chitinophagales bacterium]